MRLTGKALEMPSVPMGRVDDVRDALVTNNPLCGVSAAKT